jgi:diguanylate cyclase (GGDEF)-like protein
MIKRKLNAIHNRLFSGIFGHFLLRASIIQTLMGVLMLAILLPYYERAASDLAAEQGRTVSSSTFSATSDALYDGNYSHIIEYCLNVMKSTSNLRMIIFSNRSGEELIIRNQQWSIKHKSLPYYKINFKSSNPQSANASYLLNYDGAALGISNYYTFSKPISVAEREWGVLTLIFDNSAYLTSISTFNILVITFTLFSFLLSIILFYYSSRRIRTQIDVFTDVASKLSAGDFTVKAQESAIGEIGVLGIAVNDMSSMLQANSQKIEQLAYFDALTGLPNRRLLRDRMQNALSSSARNDKKGALLFLDLDNFKVLNDTMGHDTGDLLLQQVAARLKNCVREEDTVARLGGDEFVVMLQDLSTDSLEAASKVEAIGNNILSALNKPYSLGGADYKSTPSIGITLVNNHKSSIDELLKQADIAMYQAKKSGRNTLRFFDPAMQQGIESRAALEDDLRHALDRQQFKLHYQIQVDLFGNAIGAEVLLRWIHPERGLVFPNQFIPLAEETGLINAIGQWVLEEACAQLVAWKGDMLTQNLTLAINVSAKQLHQTNFVEQVKTTLRQYKFEPGRLKFELTESVLLKNVENTILVMSMLAEIGVKFSLDDFGTGYSSLQYLKRLPLFQLKIDQSFIRDISIDSSDLVIVSTIIAMANKLDLTVIAEGVETEEQLRVLLKCGCNEFQGYYFSKPLPVDEFEALIKKPEVG